jgi:coproporphyrinogen III oxidase
MGVQTQRAVERAMEQMQRNMDRMVDKAARHQEKLERKLEREQRRWARSADAGHGKVDLDVEGGGSEPAAEVAASASADLDAERLSILRMVEQGQIAPEEAEMLLDALEE